MSFLCVSRLASTLSPILVNNVDIILLSIRDTKEFKPLESSYSMDSGEAVILKCFEESWKQDTRSHIPQERVFQVLSSLALTSQYSSIVSPVDAGQFMNGGMSLIDSAVSSILSQTQFIPSICDFYKSMIIGIQKCGKNCYIILRIDEVLYFDGELPVESVRFLVFFIQQTNADIVTHAMPFEEWLPFFMRVIERILQNEDNDADCIV